MRNQWLADRLRELEKPQRELAEALGLERPRVSEMIKGTRAIQSDEIEPMARFLQWPAPHLLSMISGAEGKNVVTARQPIVKAPLISWINAGRYAEITDPYPAGGHDREYDVAYGRTTVIALAVVGGSMNRKAPEGSVIIVDYGDKQLVAGRYYVIRHNGEATFKRYRPNPDRFEPESTEPDHETIYPDGPVEVVGRVVRVLTEL
jgi:SOS-response transcriptional repressor LexA